MNDVTIIGAGLAGLCCGRRLAELGIPFQILEASDSVGGRVRTDRVGGFQLDRGFQILLTAYPEARRVLDYGALDLRAFSRGALIRYQGRFHRVADPRYEPLAAAWSLINPIGTPADKVRFGSLIRRLLDESAEAAERSLDQPGLDFLRWSGRFSDAMIDRFFRPFLGGVCLERNLRTTSRFVRFVMKMFAQGPGAIPARGMQAIPEQIAAMLPPGAIRFNCSVSAVEPGRITLKSGDVSPAKYVVVAVEGPEANRLLGEDVPPVPMYGTTTHYFAADRSPVGEPILVLDGDGTGPVNNLVVLSDGAPSYAPPGQSLIATSVIGCPEEPDEILERRCRDQLKDWYGESVKTWRLLRVDRIQVALPEMTIGRLDPWRRPVRLRPGCYVCGDHRDQGSIDGAMTSGYRAAQAVAEDRELKRF